MNALYGYSIFSCQTKLDISTVHMFVNQESKRSSENSIKTELIFASDLLSRL